MLHEPNNAPRAIAIADVKDNCRVVAASEVPEVTSRMQTEELCGRMIEVNGASFSFQKQTGRERS